MPALDQVKHDKEHDDCPVDQNAPVESCGVRIRRRREEHENPRHGEEQQRDDVDGRAGSPEGPTRRRERLAAESLQEDAGDADYVGGEQAGESLWHEESASSGSEIGWIIPMS